MRVEPKDPRFDLRVEGAVPFLVDKMTTQSSNPKPVIWHSLRVAARVYDDGGSEQAVIGAILHDTVEDAGVTLAELEEKFGKDIANLVWSLTFDTTIVDKTERYKDAFNRCIKQGEGAVLIRAYDILLNSDYYLLAKNKDALKFLLEKMKYFIDLSEGTIGDRGVWKALSNKHAELVKSLE